MKQLIFKTSLHCANCKSKVQDELDAIPQLNWRLDLADADKKLYAEGEDIEAEKIIELVESYGFDIELIDEK
ncbi:ATPase P [Saprospira sp. CCB-QB6]|uniref:heavy-metal-associated domain-containing protein n=1 Tax=Saprospira sp. CCB-QB6 TaxID=3023936 RepID=UPI00234AC59F|nr:ATPase P [Saprospira sp. CCB-QB6]WCL80695.1 ATPase P [Saprospira sp. CCB-QB6]